MKERLIGLLALVLCFTGCPWNEELLVFDKAAFDRERAAWEAAGIDNYAVDEVLNYDALAPNKTRVTVQDGAIVLRENLLKDWNSEHTDGINFDDPDVLSQFETMADFYAWLAAQGNSEYPDDFPFDDTEAFPYVQTISEVYAWIASEYENFLENSDGTERLVIEVDYDTTLHYPRMARVSVFPVGEDTALDGGSPGIELSNFTPLPAEE